MTITAAGLAGGAPGNNTTSVSHSVGSVTAGQLVVICGMKYSPSADPFVAADCTKSAGTATLGTISLDKTNGGADGVGAFGYTGIWSAIVTGSGTLTMQVGGAVAGSYLLIAAEAFNGNWDGTRVEATAGTDQDTTSPVSTGNATSAGAALFVGAMQNNAAAASTITHDAAFSLIYENETSTDDNGSAIYRIVSTGTTDSGDWTSTALNAGMASLVVYKEAAAAPKSFLPNPIARLLPLLVR